MNSTTPWFWLGLGGVLFALLLVERAILHHGLAPQATLEGLQPADLGLTAQSVRIPAAGRHDLHPVVSVSAFANPDQVMRRWLAARRVPYWPLGWRVNRYVESVIAARFNVIAPIHAMAHCQCPSLMVHGLQDHTVPIEDARWLWQNRAQADVTLLECNGSHESFDDLPEVTRKILDFLKHFNRVQVPRIPSLSPETSS